MKLEILERLDQLIDESSFILGPAVYEFEKAFARFTSIRHCVGVANGTDALEIALRSLELPPGSEVLVPANSFVASALAAIRAGLSVRFVDVHEETLLAHAEHFEESLTPKTRVLMPVHLYGQCAPMSEIMRLAEREDLVVVEDCAQSQGAKHDGAHAGSFGAISASSFYPGKNLGAWGDAGCVLTTDDTLVARALSLRNYGSVEKYVHESVGFNSRLDSIQALVLSLKLQHLSDWNDLRRKAAATYSELLGHVDGVQLVETLPENEHVFHLFVIRVSNREGIAKSMLSAGVTTGIHYPILIPDQQAFQGHDDYRSDRFPTARRASTEILSLPMFPGISDSQIHFTAESLVNAMEENVHTRSLTDLTP